MKKLIMALALIFALSTSGCILVDLHVSHGKGGPPSWAPAHGYRRNQTKVIYYSPSFIVVGKHGHHH